MTDRLDFRYDPAGGDGAPITVLRWGALDSRLTVDEARTMYRSLDAALVAEHRHRTCGRGEHSMVFTGQLVEGGQVMCCVRCPHEVVYHLDGTFVPVTPKVGE